MEITFSNTNFLNSRPTPAKLTEMEPTQVKTQPTTNVEISENSRRSGSVVNPGDPNSSQFIEIQMMEGFMENKVGMNGNNTYPSNINDFASYAEQKEGSGEARIATSEISGRSGSVVNPDNSNSSQSIEIQRMESFMRNELGMNGNNTYSSNINDFASYAEQKEGSEEARIAINRFLNNTSPTMLKASISS